MNYADAARIRAVLINIGMQQVDTIDEADIVILDTCSVRQKSEDKVTGKIREIPSDKKIRITGCMVQHNLRHAKVSKKLHDKTASALMKRGNFVGNVRTIDPQIIGYKNNEIKNLEDYQSDRDNIVFVNHAFNPLFFNLHKSFPNLELMMRIDDIGFIPRIARHLGYDVEDGDIELTNEYNDIIPHTNNHLSSASAKTAFVPVSTGCSQFCSYCIVPYARGLEKNLPIDKIVAEAAHHITSGVEEITLIGQIVNKHPDFDEICRQILSIDGLRWLRYTSPYPTYYSDKLLQLHESEPKMCPHIHMPLQSGSDRILKKMFRGYTSAEYRTFVDQIRALDRDISITSDIIV
jgi:tRNA A37 methylthiotransferase MiaB